MWECDRILGMCEFGSAIALASRGQYILYRNLLKLNNQGYEIYLAVRDSIFDTFFQRKSIQAVVKLNEIALIVFSNEREEIVEWIN